MALAALDHPGLQRAGEVHRRLEVDPQGALESLAGVVGQAPGPGQPRVGDERVDIAASAASFSAAPGSARSEGTNR